jgi:hypothetical protein
MTDYARVLSIHFTGKKWTLNGDSYDGLIWSDESLKPTQSELDVLWETTKAELAAKEQATKDAKASALAKLAVLGLTQDEVKALVG